MPTFGFGPGKEEFAHTANDQVRVDDLVKAAEFYAAFALFLAAGEAADPGNFGTLGTR